MTGFGPDTAHPLPDEVRVNTRELAWKLRNAFVFGVLMGFSLAASLAFFGWAVSVVVTNG